MPFAGDLLSIEEDKLLPDRMHQSLIFMSVREENLNWPRHQVHALSDLSV